MHNEEEYVLFLLSCTRSNLVWDNIKYSQMMYYSLAFAIGVCDRVILANKKSIAGIMRPLAVRLIILSTLHINSTLFVEVELDFNPRK